MKEIYPDYYVCKSGHVHSTKLGSMRQLKPKIDKDGYLLVNLVLEEGHKMKRVHRLIAEAYVPNPEGLDQVNHIDGNKKNNSYLNLEWCSCKDNLIHARDQGLHTYKLDHKTAERIRSDKGTYKELAKKYGVSVTQIGRVKRGEVWR
jgi:hypothetical protein